MIEALKNIGFVVTERLERKELSSDLQNRYSELPADYQEFLQRFQTITNESDNVWFNSIEDFNGESDSGFRWNEFELMGLEALADDKESCDMIRLFWDSHIPILRNPKISEKAWVYLLASPIGQLQFNRAESGASGQTSVTEEDLRRFRFPTKLLAQIDALAKELDLERKKINLERCELDKREHEAWEQFSLKCLCNS